MSQRVTELSACPQARSDMYRDCFVVVVVLERECEWMRIVDMLYELTSAFVPVVLQPASFASAERRHRHETHGVNQRNYAKGGGGTVTERSHGADVVYVAMIE